MKFSGTRWTVMLAVAVGLMVGQSAAEASIIPITFESSKYSSMFTHSGLPAGTINTQDGWDTFSGGVGSIAVTQTNPIVGNQSLAVVGGSSSQTRSQASGLLTDGSLNPIIPSALTWLVRVDSLGSSTGAARAFESGITTDATTGVTPFTIIFNRSLGLQYYTGTNTTFPTGPSTYTVGTTYRVEITNISDLTGKYDAAIYNNSDSTNTPVASVTGAALLAPIGTAGVKFYVLQRNTNGGTTMVDSITATAVPEPGCLMLGGIGAALIVAVRRRQK